MTWICEKCSLQQGRIIQFENRSIFNTHFLKCNFVLYYPLNEHAETSYTKEEPTCKILTLTCLFLLILENLGRGHSTTTWTKLYPILTTYPPRGNSCQYFTYILPTRPSVDFLLLTTYLPLLVHVGIECPQILLLFGGIHNWSLINYYLTNCIAFFVFFIPFLNPNALLENAFSHFYSGYCVAFTSWLAKVTENFLIKFAAIYGGR